MTTFNESMTTFNETEKSGKDPVFRAQELSDQGYCRVSNKYRIVARIDREDWIQWIIDKDNMNITVADFYTKDGDLSYSWADYYRRVYSRDKIENVPSAIFKLLPSSGDGVGFKPKKKSNI